MMSEPRNNLKTVEVIEIKWEGAFTVDEVKEKNDISDYGIYQIYGTHSVFGMNALLYIGKASDQRFGKRLNQHYGWMINEIADLTIYLGKVGGETQVDDIIWGNHIDYAEQLLIYFCSPPYNTKNLSGYNIPSNLQKGFTVLNFGKRNRLPLEVSTLYHDSNYWSESKMWQVYQEKDSRSPIFLDVPPAN